MSLNLPYAIQPVNPLSNIDNRYGPWISCAGALSGTSGTRCIGLTVGIVESGAVVEYWFKTGITNTDLVVKSLGGVGNGTVTGATNGLSLINSGTTVVLGGNPLTQNTSIIGNYSLCIGSPSCRLTDFVVNTTGNSMMMSSNAYVQVCGQSDYIDISTVGGPAIVLYGSGGSPYVMISDVQPNLAAIQVGSGAVSLNGQLALLDTPTGGTTSDMVLVRNSGGSVRQISVASITGITQSAMTYNSNTVNVCLVDAHYSATTTNDFIGVITGNSCSYYHIWLPPIPKPGQRISVVDIGICALTNNICVIGTNGRKVNGQDFATINTDYGSITFINNGFTWSAVAFIN